MPTKDYSEEEMADAFEQRLRSRRPLPGVGRFSQVFREVQCHRGRPDFVALTARKSLTSFPHRNSHSLGAACVLSLMKSRASRSVVVLAKQSRLSHRVVARTVRELLHSGLIEELSPGQFVLSSNSDVFEIESTAFELKLKSPRRAIFQAQQYTMFAQRVWIVVPPERISSFDSYRPVLERWNIGLASFDIHTHRFRVAMAARGKPPVSREHQAYALLRVVGGHCA